MLTKTPRIGQPFWCWINVDGRGCEWLLTMLYRSESEGLMMKFLTEDFEDSWDPEEWDDTRIIAITTPEDPQ